MSTYNLTPLLSEEDPPAASEGNLDPLGLYSIADNLALQLVPGMRERQSHPRFLTATAVSLAVCSGGEFPPETVAADKVSEPWQVFEWYMVEGLVRTAETHDETRGLPGTLKARQALQDQVPLSAARYLKTPTVFGFHGVYRVLAKELRIEQSDRLGERGYELLMAWSRDQGLPGFYGTADGDGRRVRKMLVDAVRDGLQRGATDRSGGWEGWDFFKKHLSVYQFGKEEGRIIQEALRGAPGSPRRQILDFVVSPAAVQSINEDDEYSFHQAFFRAASEDIKHLLRAIFVYEQFARFLQDAFNECQWLMTARRGKTSLDELSQAACVQLAARKLPGLFGEVADRLEDFGQSVRFRDAFGPFGEPADNAAFAQKLIEHHKKTQRQKPPNGKNPWIEVFDDWSMVIRPGYERPDPVQSSEKYVHQYRMHSLWSFAKDLGMVK